MKQITLYTRERCHLCHVAHDVLERVRARIPFDLSVIDLDREASPEVKEQYNIEVPVVELDGRKIMKYRIDEARLERLLTEG
jgi:glutaredoxin